MYLVLTAAEIIKDSDAFAEVVSIRWMDGPILTHAEGFCVGMPVVSYDVRSL